MQLVCNTKEDSEFLVDDILCRTQIVYVVTGTTINGYAKSMLIITVLKFTSTSKTEPNETIISSMVIEKKRLQRVDCWFVCVQQ